MTDAFVCIEKAFDLKLHFVIYKAISLIFKQPAANGTICQGLTVTTAWLGRRPFDARSNRVWPPVMQAIKTLGFSKTCHIPAF